MSKDEHGHGCRNEVTGSDKGELPKGDNLKQNHRPSTKGYQQRS
jgi:hypothetical protein